MTIHQHSSFGLAEKRQFQRVAMSLSGRYMLESRDEYPCQTVDISPGGMLIQAPVNAGKGEKVVIYLDALGRFAGAAVRQTQHGFSMILDMSAKKREKLADQLTWFANHTAIGLPDNREHPRIVPFMQRAILRFPHGHERLVKIIDLSIASVGVETDVLPALGAPIFIGSTAAVVVRHFAEGFAAEFVTPFAAGQINAMTRL